MSDTRFIAFYSYKGGVGRSLALANLAYLLALSGRKVLIMDLDLEAPGQQRTDLFFEQDRPSPFADQGILELLSTYVEHCRRDECSKFVDWKLEDWIRRSHLFERRVTELKEIHAPDSGVVDNPGAVWLMPAGGRGAEYRQKLAEWDWDRFFDRDSGEEFLELLKARIQEAGFDDVLIDSRTGLSDVFYVSTLLLADTVVCLTGLNRQNIAGTAEAAETVLNSKPREEGGYGEKRLLLALSPLPPVTEKEVSARLRQIKEEWPALDHWHCELPYVPHLALEERILAMESENPLASRDAYVQGVLKLAITLNEDDTPPAVVTEDQEPLNPFPAIRIEYWRQEEVAQYFVDPGGNISMALNQFMPTVLFGSRGTGKTTLARWYAYDTQSYLLQQEGRAPGPGNPKHIGLWFRLDIDLLNAFNTEEQALLPSFNRLFGQFLDLLVVRKALAALDELGGLIVWAEPGRLLAPLAREMGKPAIRSNLQSFEGLIEDHLSAIRAFINNPETVAEPYRFQGNILMKLLVQGLVQHGAFQKGQYFSVFIDEYENLHSYQQRIVNTRLKQARESDRVTYKILARNNGIHTYETLAEGQPIEDTHDFRRYNLDEGVEYEKFEEHMVKVVRLHLSGSGFFSRRGMMDPKELFPALTPDQEALRLAGKRGNDPLKAWIEKEYGREELGAMLDWMDREPSLLRQAVAVVVLNQGKLLAEVVKAFKNEDKRSGNWYHNYHIGALYWLCSLYKTPKVYSGFGQIVGIAGNNTRVALDLCYAIVERWFSDDPDQSLPIATEIQNRAIRSQSTTYFRKLTEQGQHGDCLSTFVERLGRLFEVLHKGPRQSEPEINHFQIADEPDTETEAMLQRCREEAILRWLPGNKQKSSSDQQRNAWQLHPRYAPFFNVSWRRKKMLRLSGADLKVLFFGTQKEWRALMSRVEKQRHPKYNQNPIQRSLL